MSSPSLSDLLAAVDRQPPHYVHPTLVELCAAFAVEISRLSEEVTSLRATIIALKEVINAQAAVQGTSESLQGASEAAGEGSAEASQEGQGLLTDPTSNPISAPLSGSAVTKTVTEETMH